MSLHDADYATSKFMKWHRGLSLALVLVVFAAVAVSSGLGQGVRAVAIFVLPLVLIWQSEHLAHWAIKDSGHWLNAGNADRWVRVCGWVILGLMAGIRGMAFFGPSAHRIS